ncbi:single-stranded DNA-binding protein [Roseobacter sp. YSTF-M11]|uniref:Single-stranded DNA-binding protein n=1 Tax=Roseobacter insulae TaxID=2859783 RepID=A0A9X1FZ43_9RHOB|nr:single-stranded DNA-binding protein [Roseobacter insulae]MBW4709583.1 single-stranded DNA-binding protein [Roseobacter insulae]
MSLSVNEVKILGNVGEAPQIRSFENGGRVANFSVATSRRWKNRNTGEVTERTEWHRINVTADHLVKVAEDFLRKGSKVFLSGRLETRKWQDQSGQDRYSTEVVLAPYEGVLISLDRREGSAAPGGSNGSDTPPPSRDPDDEIPF